MAAMDAYRGDYPVAMGKGFQAADQMVGNITFSIINTMVAQLSSRSPDPILRPIGGPAAGSDARRRAWLNEQLVEFMVRDRKFKKEADMAILSAVLGGAGFVRHGYTPEVEFFDDNGKIITRFKNQTPDLPWVQFMRPWEVRVDTMVNSFAPDSEPRWCAFYKTHFEHQIRGNENMTFRRDLVPTKHIDIRDPQSQKSGPSRAGDPDSMSMYEEWTIYDADERKFFGISPGSDKLIREERDWPFEWGQLPYSYLAFNDQLDTPFPISFPSMFRQEQMMYNKIWTIINALVGRVRRLIFVNKSGMDETMMELLENPEAFMEMVGVEGDVGNIVKEIGVAGIDQSLIGLLFQLKEQIREVLGVSSFDRGQRANVETAAEAGQIAAGGQIARGRTQERFEAFWANMIRVSHRALLQSDDARQFVIPVLGKQNLEFLGAADRENGFIKVSLEDLQGEFSYDVKLDSTLRTDPNTELARFGTSYNLLGGKDSQMINQTFAHQRIMELGGADPQQAIIDEKTQAKMAENAQGSGEEGAAPDSANSSAAQNTLGAGLRGVLGAA
jgi:hypothetical protein